MQWKTAPPLSSFVLINAVVAGESRTDSAPHFIFPVSGSLSHIMDLKVSNAVNSIAFDGMTLTTSGTQPQHESMNTISEQEARLKHSPAHATTEARQQQRQAQTRCVAVEEG